MKGGKQQGGVTGVKNGWAGPLLSQGCPPPTPFACAALVSTNYPLLGSCHACCWLNCMPNCMIVVQAQLGCAPVQVGLIGPNRLPHPRCAYCVVGENKFHSEQICSLCLDHWDPLSPARKCHLQETCCKHSCKLWPTVVAMLVLARRAAFGPKVGLKCLVAGKQHAPL